MRGVAPRAALRPHRIGCGTLRLLLAAAAMLLQAGAAAAAGRTLTIPAPDGRSIPAYLIEAGPRALGSAVLVPMLGRSKDDWIPLAGQLAQAGIAALAIDLPAGALPQDSGAAASWHADVTAAVEFLAARGGAAGRSIGVIGASFGASLAALAAAADPHVRSLALVSPSLDYRGVRIEAAMRQYGARPAVMLASRRDPYAGRSVRALADDPPGVREVYWSEEPAHGTLLLARDPDLDRVLVEWFQRTLGVH